ncbi:MAG: hypothetical protein IBJ18_04130 [Phycisphaerales bacterium]|nr:hypothetical protein [Phycisphaerales bacterium]
MIAADERLCQRCFTPHEARGVMTCGTCGHFFHGDEDRAEHMYAAFRDYAGRVGSVPFLVVVILLVCDQVFGAFGVKLESLTGVHLVYIIVGSQVCAIAITASVNKRRDDRVRRANFCCCERCGHPFDWQVSEEQLKSYDSDKQPPETITCTECGETFSPLAVYRRWRHALN